MKLVQLGLLVSLLILILQRPFLDLSQQLMPAHHAHKQLPTHVVKRMGMTVNNAKQGVDLSHFQGTVNFQEVANSGIHFVYLKATQGTDFIDPSYAAHITAIDKTALLHGAYHYFQPDQDPIAQAKYFLQQVQMSGHVLPPMLDVETTSNESPDSVRKGVAAWLEYVHKALNCRPILYSYGDFWQDNLGPAFNEYPFWLADYSAEPDVPAGLKNMRLWQYSDTGRVPGIENQVDLDVLVSGEVNCHV